MKLDTYQARAYKTASYNDAFYPWASLIIESAELADLVAKPWLRGDGAGKFEEIPRAKVISEAGDVLWNLAAILTDHNISLEEVAKANLKKLDRRAAAGTIQGSGDR